MSSFEKKVKRKPALYLISLGCAKNTVDSEKVLNRLFSRDFDFTTEALKADAAIINTCGFIAPALTETEDTMKEMMRIKRKKKNFKVFAMGCAVTRKGEEWKKMYKDMDGFFGLGQEEQMYDVLSSLFRESLEPEKASAESFERKIGITLPHYAYLKIAEGCSRFCTYCAIPSIRGPYHSVSKEDLIREARGLEKRGVKELLLIAQDTTVYGKDLYGAPALKDLLDELEKLEGLRWIRLLYAYPEVFDAALMDKLLSSSKILKYLDLPIQHSHPEVLKRMGRAKTFEVFDEIFTYLRKKNPDYCLRTTVITGFPGETEEQFSHLLQYIRKMRFDRLGVFQYYSEQGTPAAELENPVPAKIKKRRYETLMLTQQNIVFEKNRSWVGRDMDVIVESQTAPGQYVGRSFRDAPDIDTFVEFESKKVLNSGDIVSVRITGTQDYDLSGKMNEGKDHV